MAAEWMPIETVPEYSFNPAKWYMDGPRYLLWIGHTTIGWYGYTQKGKGRWKDWSGNVRPSHWMPLPERPNDAV